MGHQVIHILKHGSVLSADRGCLVCKCADTPDRRAPFDDILAVVVSARGVAFTNDAMSRLLSNKAVILHCDENYRPIGKTVPLPYIVFSEIFARQINSPPDFCLALWQKILKGKIANQAIVLDALKAEHSLWEMIKTGNLDESNSARQYWKNYFKMFGRKRPKTREGRNAEHPANQMLNYSYAVISAIIHRSLVAHGLNTNLGVYHKYRFKADPLVYDMVEPFRPVCDFLLLRFHIRNPRREIKDWIKQVAKELMEFKISLNGSKPLKLINAVDRYIISCARAFEVGSPQLLKPPTLSGLKFEQ